MLSTNVEDWLPTDGDTFVTKEDFIFNVFGYEHLENRVIAFLKYIPADFKSLFNVRYLKNTWTYKERKVFRAERLYTPENYQNFLKVFKNNLPDYLYYCPYRQKELISSPKNSIEELYLPKECLTRLATIPRKDNLQKTALDLVELLSNESKVRIEDFGLHGSIALNMHSSKSDIDLVVYGAHNFRKIERTIDCLVRKTELSYIFKNRVEEARRFKGKYRGNLFMYNAVRKSSETNSKYGLFKFTPISKVKFKCKVRDDSEAMFRPAIYRVTNVQHFSPQPRQAEGIGLETVVSMIGCYRNVARKGDKIEVSGMLEHVENLETEKANYQVVVGTGTTEDEYVWPA